MMSELFDEEYLRNQYNLAERRKNFAEGMQQGMLQGMEKGILTTLISLVKKGILTLSQAAEQANMSVAEFERKARLAE